MSHVFVSYSRDNSDYADELTTLLESEGIDIWIDRGGMMPGSRYRRTIRDAIDSCVSFLVIMSTSSGESDWVENELDWAERRGKPIFALLLDGEPFFGLTTTHYEDVTSGCMPSRQFLGALSAIGLDPHEGAAHAQDRDERSSTTKNPPQAHESVQPTSTFPGDTTELRPEPYADDPLYVLAVLQDVDPGRAWTAHEFGQATGGRLTIQRSLDRLVSLRYMRRNTDGPASYTITQTGRNALDQLLD